MSALTSPEVSVVVATRDRPGRLAALISSLDAQSLARDRFEIVVVDDASATTLELRPDGAKTAQLRLITHPDALGPAAARNRGWQEARGGLIAFTDDDCEADSEWLARLLDAHRSSPEAIVQGRTGPILRELDRFGPFGRTRVVDRPTIYYETCNVAYPRELLERVGGFDETFPEPAGEDADLGWRVRESGAERVFAQDAVVHHAVEDVGLRGYLRDARRGPTSMQMMSRHPGLRERALYHRHFWHRNHALALVAVAGVALLALALIALAGAVQAIGIAAGALLVLPWLRTLAGRNGAVGGRPWHLPAHALFDLVEIGACARHAIRCRILVV